MPQRGLYARWFDALEIAIEDQRMPKDSALVREAALAACAAPSLDQAINAATAVLQARQNELSRHDRD